MLHNLAWHATYALTLAQLNMVHALADRIGLTSDDRRRALKLTEHEWQIWTEFSTDGSLSAEPPLPEMLLRLGEVAFNLSILADDRDIAACPWIGSGASCSADLIGPSACSHSP